MGSPHSFMHCGVSPLREWAIRALAILRRCAFSPRKQRPRAPSRSGSIRCMRCFASDPERASPYHPSDRRCSIRSPSMCSTLPEPLLTERVRRAIEEAQPEASRLSAKPFVDYAAVAALKNPLFDAAHAAFRDLARNRPADPLIEDFTAFRAGWRRDAAAFRDLHCDRGHASESRAKISLSRSNRRWAPELRPSRRPMRTRFPAPCFCNGSRTGSLPPPPVECRLTLGFYRDLAVGCAPDGAEAWAEPELFMRGVSIGAPPDLAWAEWSGVGSSALSSTRAGRRRLCRFRPA